ncbi:hypothetical protein IH601_07920 [Candidatus Bipolaricaulota bacterium]|nr:hypothetical protein [Candidatus Bipolaricaulota bacterium]TFH09377.1 MAG: hypothetical protein E4H08_05895 [Candidatus Atribacteria bacterium]
MRKSLPVWSIPFILALAGIAAVIGNLSFDVLLVVGIETIIISAYLVFLGRRAPSNPQPSSNLLSLLPGHLLVLIILALLDVPGLLPWLWTLIPIATLAYDATARSTSISPRTRMSISMILYVILWADLFFLLERAVVLHRQLPGNREIMIAAAFGLAGALFLSMGIYRHWIAAKE